MSGSSISHTFSYITIPYVLPYVFVFMICVFRVSDLAELIPQSVVTAANLRIFQLISALVFNKKTGIFRISGFFTVNKCSNKLFYTEIVPKGGMSDIFNSANRFSLSVSKS